MHLQQTKVASRKSGGPQYYFHNVDEPIKDFLRKKGVCDVVLQTPYGMALSPFKAVGAQNKWEDGAIKSGKVGHDRIQQAGADESIGEAIRKWYCLPKGDFERIDIEVVFQPQKLSSGKKAVHFVICPTSAKMRGKQIIPLPASYRPLSIDKDYISPLWKKQLERSGQRQSKNDIKWVIDQIAIVVDDHLKESYKNLHEADILRVSGALNAIGIQLGPYRTKDYDCDPSRFEFYNYPAYFCPVEIKKQSKDFRYQEQKYFPLPRAVVLCLEHNHPKIPNHIDVIELKSFGGRLSSFL